MKRLILNIILACISVTAMAEGNTWLMLQMSNGSRISYIVPGKMRVSFSGEDMQLTSDRLTATMHSKCVLRYQFFNEDNITDGIKETMLNDVKITYHSRDIVEISGLPTGQRIKVYESNGTEQRPHITHTSDKARIDLSALANGVFIITFPDSDIPAVKIIH